MVNPEHPNPAYAGAVNLNIQAQNCDSIFVRGQSGTRLAFEQIDTEFTGDNEQLKGRLVLPLNVSKVPVVVMVHGSESTSAVQFNAWQRQLPALGIGFFVYDKRGTGGSTGRYSQDFQLLANDAAAAVLEARRLAGDRLESLALLGTSQGGWVAPLAATRTPVDRIIVGYGLAISPNDEDREQVLLEMRTMGYSDADITAAEEVARATGTLMASGFREEFNEYARVRKAYQSRAWFSKISGEYTGDDTEAPPETTLHRLSVLKRSGKPLTILEFPNTDHGIVEFIESNGERISTRVAEGYLRAVVDFARHGELVEPDYGSAREVN